MNTKSSTTKHLVPRSNTATHAQLQFYAPQAEVRLTSIDDPTAARTLHGHTEIERWIDQRGAEDNITFQVTYHWIGADELMVTEEWRRPDGTTSLTASSSRINQGLIISQSVVRITNT